MSNIPKPASPLPWAICREVPGYSDEGHILHDRHHYKVAMHMRLTAGWPADLAYIIWAANNAQALYEALDGLLKATDLVRMVGFVGPNGEMEPSYKLDASFKSASAALKAARGEV